MQRTSSHRALVLSVRQSGESNRDAVFLTADAGLLRALLFGGPKSKLRAFVSPFNGGDLELYRDPVRDSRKVVDFDVKRWRPGLREVLERSYAAQAVAETIIASHGGGGGWEEALDLADECLDVLEDAPAAQCSMAFTRFLWKWSEFLGCRPELDECGVCACPVRTDEVVYYSRRDGTVACGRCAGDGWLNVGAGARSWLRAQDRADAAQALRINADASSLRQAAEAAKAVAGQAVGDRPRTWDLLETN